MGVLKLCTDGSWAVNGQPIYPPSDLSYGHEGLQAAGSGRAESGYMIKTWVRGDVRNVELEYRYLTGSEKQYLMDLMQGKDFSFTYYDGGVQSISSAYCNKTSYKGYRRRQFAEEGGLYKDFKIKIIEN